MLELLNIYFNFILVFFLVRLTVSLRENQTESGHNGFCWIIDYWTITKWVINFEN